ncbi:MAG TPA: amino acid permease [Bacillota bacterium]|nr:amino acid permease [Bacillota bacterium]
MSNHDQKLQRKMSERHIMMIALGGAIGAGIFKGSSSAINMAGPSVILAYVLGGIIMLFVMQGMAEMAVQHKEARTFRDLIEPNLGSFSGYFIGWIYWTFWVLAMAAEAVVAASFLQYWLPNIPIWSLSLIISIAITVLNLFSVKIFAETEYWFAFIKVFVILLFIIFGFVVLLVPFGSHSAVGFSNLTAHGGFFPNGIVGVIHAMLVVIFSYGGTEMIGVTLAEAKDPQRVIPKAVRSTFVRIVAFYVLPFLVIVSLLPWNQVDSSKDSPFIMVFELMGIPYVGDIMNAVMLTAVLSSMNTGMYAASRVLYTQSTDGRAWKLFSQLSTRQIPVYSILVGTVALYVGVLVEYFIGGTIFEYLMTSLGYTILLIWFFISAAHLKSRQNATQLTGYYVKLYPYTTWVALISIVTIFIGVLATTPAAGSLVTFGMYGLICLFFLINKRKISLQDKNHSGSVR